MMPCTTVPRPLCARCSRAVDQLYFHEDANTRDVLLIAVCHGEAETIRVPRGELALNGGQLTITIGRAFDDTNEQRGLRTRFKQ